MASTTKITGAIATTFLLFSILISSAESQISPMGAASGPSMAMAPAAPSPGLDCLSVLVNMSSCLTFVEQGSNLTKPDKECCPELAGLVDSNPICLCQLLGDPDKLGVQIDINRALKLPNICTVETPPVSTCAALGIPVAAPTASDELVPALSPGGFASSPTSENNDKNAAQTMAFSKMHIVLGFGIMFFQNIF
ncbi:non-specific lipid transfer protein GPI-anchored 2 [Nicotiana tabacum]|uniref:Non-specific lipid transfer protein GPI-anchored 2 n=1 Tax=Nicotiana tabacum TaxID=4097 RepID=A0A1S3X013_TOBAC|nr:PREDICTED: non-specific lipid transfer protein GPI-anchored 2-like [Nicotiana tabacum]